MIWHGHACMARSECMGRLLQRLERKCPFCNHIGFPRRISGQYKMSELTDRVLLWECIECEYIWKDKQMKSKRRQVSAQ